MINNNSHLGDQEMELKNQVAEKVNDYFEIVKDRYLSYMNRMGYENQIRLESMKLTKGSKYAKVHINGSVHSFVDLTNGNVLKPASWRAPAKHARGNILSEHGGGEAMYPNEYCIKYLK